MSISRKESFHDDKKRVTGSAKAQILMYWMDHASNEVLLRL